MKRARSWMSLRERLDMWSSPTPSGCRLWQGSTDGRMGYGKLRWAGRMQYAHRLSFIDAFGPIPDGLVLRHSCDVPACIEPAHLSVGTQRENVRDSFNRGRARRLQGEMHPLAVLTDEQAAEIRRRYRKGSRIAGQCALAREFKTSQMTVWRVLNHITHKETVQCP